MSEAHRLSCHSTLGLRVIEKKKKVRVQQDRVLALFRAGLPNTAKLSPRAPAVDVAGRWTRPWLVANQATLSQIKFVQVWITTRCGLPCCGHPPATVAAPPTE